MCVCFCVKNTVCLDRKPVWIESGCLWPAQEAMSSCPCTAAWPEDLVSIVKGNMVNDGK